MKILHLVTSLDFGGVERRMEILSKYPSSSNKLTFCALGGGGRAYQIMSENGANVRLLGCDFRIFRVGTLLSLLRYINRLRPDIIHAHGAEANFYGGLAGLLLRVKVRIAEEIGIPSYSKKSKQVFRLVFKMYHSVIAMSPAVKEFLCNRNVVDSDKIDLVCNPVLMSSVLKSDYVSGDCVDFSYLGRLEKVKNPDGLLRAFHLFLDQGGSAKLHFIGDGSLAVNLKDYVAVHGLNKHVFFHGYSSDPFSILLKTDVVVQPSHSEGFSLALVEAMSCGLPALATPFGGALDLLEDGGGWLISSSEDQDILEGLNRVIQEKSEIKVQGEKALDVVGNRFDAREYSGELDMYYSLLMKQLQ